jgi:hypothetical protein
LTGAPDGAASGPEPRLPGASPWWSSHRPLGRAARIGLAAGLFGLAILLQVRLCAFAWITGSPCPGCGLTRATLALLRGRVGEAISFHPLSIVLSPLVAIVLGYNATSYVRRGVWSASESIRGTIVTAIAAVLLVALFFVWIARFLGAFGGPVSV